MASITTINATRTTDGEYILTWGDADGNLYATDELPADFRAGLDPDYTHEQYATLAEVTEIVEAARGEMGLMSVPDEHGGECIVI